MVKYWNCISEKKILSPTVKNAEFDDGCRLLRRMFDLQYKSVSANRIEWNAVMGDVIEFLETHEK